MIAEAKRLDTVKEYYFSRKLKEVRERVASGRPVINLGIGSPDLAPPKGVTDALKDGLEHPGAHQYQSYQGLPELRQSITEFYASHYGTHLDPGTEVLPLMGSKEGIMHISMAFLNPGDEALIPDPGYPTYSSVTALSGGVPRKYILSAERDWFLDLEALGKEDLSKVKLMWVSYPHMPTGASANREKFARLIAFAREHNILLINDNPYSFILGGEPLSILSVPGAAGVALELNSLSKTFNMAGWRVGMLVGEGHLLQSVLKVKSNMDSGMFYGVQQGAIAALRCDASWYETQDEIYRLRRQAVQELATALGCTYEEDTTGLFVWARLPEGSPDSETSIDLLLEQYDLFVAPGTIFGHQGEGYIRFSLCVPEEKIREALQRVGSDLPFSKSIEKA